MAINTINWLGTTALVVLLGTGTALAQAPENSQKRDEAPRAQSSSPQNEKSQKDKEGDRSAATQQKPSDRSSDRNAQSEPKERGKEPQRAQDTSSEKAQGGTNRQEQSRRRENEQSRQQQSQDRQGKEDKQQQSEDQRGKDSKQQNQAEQGQSQRQDQQRDRNEQAAQPNAQKRQGEAAQDRQRDQTRQRDQSAGQDSQRNRNEGQATNQSRDRNVSVSDEQRTQIVDRLRRDRDSVRTNVNINVNVGERLPVSVQPRRLPPEIVSIVPQYRDYDYTIVRDEIVIVDPRTREVVQVLDDRGGASGGSYAGGVSHRIQLSSEQRDTLRHMTRRTTGSASSQDQNCLMLQPMPDDLARAKPELSSYRVLIVGDNAVIVDPRDQKVIDVID